MYVVSIEFEQLAKRYASTFYVDVQIMYIYGYGDMEMY